MKIFGVKFNNGWLNPYSSTSIASDLVETNEITIAGFLEEKNAKEYASRISGASVAAIAPQVLGNFVLAGRKCSVVILDKEYKKK